MFATLLAATLCALARGAQVPATSPLVQWTGRVVRNYTAGDVSFDWESARALFTVRGATAVWATLGSTFWAAPPAGEGAARALQQAQFPKFGVYRVYVDGLRQGADLGGIVVAHGTAEYALVDGLDPARSHNISLWFTTDPVFNSWPDLDAGRGCKQTVVALRTDGDFAPPPPLRERSMLILGDSITSGNAMFKPCDNATKCDSSQSYAGLICEAFALNCTQLTASSKGLVHNCCDDLTTTVPVLANRTFAQDNSSQFDWAAAPYDAAWVHLGTNDGSKATPAAFSAAYLSLLRNVARHGVKNDIPIFAAWGPNSALFAPWVAAAAANATAEGLNVHLVDLMDAPLDGCGHPGVLGHPAMARLAAPAIAAATGWPWSHTNFSSAP